MTKKDDAEAKGLLCLSFLFLMDSPEHKNVQKQKPHLNKRQKRPTITTLNIQYNINDVLRIYTYLYTYNINHYYCFSLHVKLLLLLLQAIHFHVLLLL